ncbi:MAG: hypothetical protein U0K54_04000 [Acutalibacteraceae bacterium]|nr:hypothetical protein [Acutalibacteraceae bacterium]
MKRFFRCFFWSLIIIGNLTLLCWGVCKAYVNIRRISYGEYTHAIELGDNSFKILDFYIEF